MYIVSRHKQAQPNIKKTVRGRGKEGVKGRGKETVKRGKKSEKEVSGSGS
jgi:hypothetical protein